MRTNRRILCRIFPLFCGILALILDAPTASKGAREGIALCLETVVPSLFPFFFMSALLVGTLRNYRFFAGDFLCRAWNLPKGCESILLIALTGGYPIGAKTVSDACEQKMITKEDTLHMIGFCNNAGPAFILGITPMLFSSPMIPWILWLLQILSAWATAKLQGHPGKTAMQEADIQGKVTYTAAMLQSLRSMALVCGWIILFRVLIALFQKWLLYPLPVWLRVFVCGLLELSNGCCMLSEIPHEDVRFFLCALFLCAGGLCVTMQTVSMLHHLDASAYFRGKALQCGICLLMTAASLPFLFPDSAFPKLASVISAILLSIVIVFSFVRNSSRKKEENRV